jgi:hypothetical protein
MVAHPIMRQVELLSPPALRFDLREWPFTNMADLGLAIEGAKAGLAMICAPRKPDSVQMLDKNKVDSIFAGLKGDDSRQMRRASQPMNVRAGISTRAVAAEALS